jgi:ubiquinone/menaquinone biosynthesis C-methylase UbiE
MEERKRKEIEHYDKKAESLLKEQSEEKVFGDFEGFKPQDLSSFRFLYKLLGNYCNDKLVLDYGCGNGVHSVFPLKAGAKKVIAIDLSGKSLEIAKNRLKKEGLGEKIEFIEMDCEKTEFPDNHFDLVLDSGTFSSLDINKVFPELGRILKSDGVLVGIETFGHNPLANLKRSFNKVFGKRTSWAAEHIFHEKDIKEAGKYFSEIETYFFHPISFLTFPFLSYPGGKILLKIFELFDRVLLIFPFLRKYSFKVVFVFKNPIKNV